MRVRGWLIRWAGREGACTAHHHQPFTALPSLAHHAHATWSQLKAGSCRPMLCCILPCRLRPGLWRRSGVQFPTRGHCRGGVLRRRQARGCQRWRLGRRVQRWVLAWLVAPGAACTCPRGSLLLQHLRLPCPPSLLQRWCGTSPASWTPVPTPCCCKWQGRMSWATPAPLPPGAWLVLRTRQPRGEAVHDVLLASPPRPQQLLYPRLRSTPLRAAMHDASIPPPAAPFLSRASPPSPPTPPTRSRIAGCSWQW